jgi:hypothetical protein
MNSSFVIIEQAPTTCHFATATTVPGVICPVDVVYDHAVAATHSVRDSITSVTGQIGGHYEDEEDDSAYPVRRVRDLWFERRLF